MLIASQIEQFRTHGFVVLRGLLGGAAAALRAEVDAALRDAYAVTYDHRVIDGISGHYLPMASRLTPLSAGLVCDDPRLMAAAEELLGGPVVPECPEGVLYFAEAGWHTDDGIGVIGLKFATYFDRLDAGNGALRFLPRSHATGNPAHRLLHRPIRRDGPTAPLTSGLDQAVESEPGDVIAFDLHTRHCSVGGRDRLAWTICYQRCPETDCQRERCHRSMLDSFEQAFRGFNRDRYPIWRDWTAGADPRSRRAAVIERMRAAGILELRGADIGW
jgi:hypothetical protein